MHCWTEVETLEVIQPPATTTFLHGNQAIQCPEVITLLYMTQIAFVSSLQRALKLMIIFL